MFGSSEATRPAFINEFTGDRPSYGIGICNLRLSRFAFTFQRRATSLGLGVALGGSWDLSWMVGSAGGCWAAGWRSDIGGALKWAALGAVPPVGGDALGVYGERVLGRVGGVGACGCAGCVCDEEAPRLLVL